MFTHQKFIEAIRAVVPVYHEEEQLYEQFLLMRDKDPRMCLRKAFAELRASVYNRDGTPNTEPSMVPWEVRHTRMEALCLIYLSAAHNAQVRGEDPYQAGWFAFMDCIRPVEILAEILYADRLDVPDHLRDVALILRAARVRSGLSLTYNSRLKKATAGGASLIAEILTAAPSASCELDYSAWENMLKLPSVAASWIEGQRQPDQETAFSTDAETGATLDIHVDLNSPSPLALFEARHGVAVRKQAVRKFLNSLKGNQRRLAFVFIEHPELEEDEDRSDKKIAALLGLQPSAITSARQSMWPKWERFKKSLSIY